MLRIIHTNIGWPAGNFAAISTKTARVTTPVSEEAAMTREVAKPYLNLRASKVIVRRYRDRAATTIVPI